MVSCVCLAYLLDLPALFHSGFSFRFVFSLLIHCRNYDGFPGRALRDVVITVTVKYRSSSNTILGWELGIALGDALGILLGTLLGSSDGVLDGSKLLLLGELLGASDGALDGAEPPPWPC